MNTFKIFLKCGQCVCKVFGCRLLGFCGDSAGVGLFNFFCFVCICSELLLVSGMVIFYICLNTVLIQRFWNTVVGIIGWP